MKKTADISLLGSNSLLILSTRFCTKSRRAKVRQGKNRRGTVGVAADFTGVNEHSEPVFNAAWPSADTLRTKPKAHACQKDKLQPFGQFVPLASTDEGFTGFHVARVLQDAVIWAASDYREQDARKMLYTPTLKQSSVEENYVFMLQESQTRIYAFRAFLRIVKSMALPALTGLSRNT